MNIAQVHVHVVRLTPIAAVATAAHQARAATRAADGDAGAAAMFVQLPLSSMLQLPLSQCHWRCPRRTSSWALVATPAGVIAAAPRSRRASRSHADWLEASSQGERGWQRTMRLWAGRSPSMRVMGLGDGWLQRWPSPALAWRKWLLFPATLLPNRWMRWLKGILLPPRCWCCPRWSRSLRLWGGRRWHWRWWWWWWCRWRSSR